MRNSGRSRFFTTLAAAILLLTNTLSSASFVHTSTGQSSKAIENALQKPSTSTNSRASSPKSIDKVGHVYAPHWSTKTGFATTIYIRNVNVVASMRARLSLVLKHRTIMLSERRIGPAQTIAVNVGGELTTHGERAEQEGGADIEYVASSSSGGINSWAQVVDEARSLSFSFPFMHRGANHEGPIDAVAWHYDRDTTAFVSLQNTTNSPVTVSPMVFLNGQASVIEQKRLKPFEAATVRLPGPPEDAAYPYSEGVRIGHDGQVGAVVAQGWAMNSGHGFSTTFAFHSRGVCPCGPNERRHLYGTGMMIGTGNMMAPNATFDPQLALRNNSDDAMLVTPIFKYHQNRDLVSLTLPNINLAPQETIIKNLRQYQQDGIIPSTVSDGDIQLDYNSTGGSLIGELASVDTDGSLVSAVPLICSGNRAPHMAFWRTDGDWDSMLALENISNETNEVEITISYSGGLYVTEKTLAAGETTMLSVKELQHDQTPGRDGHTIPITATMGGMNIWSNNVNHGLVINGMVFNPVTRTCGYCGGFGIANDWGLTDTPGSNCYAGFRDYEINSTAQVSMCISFDTGRSGTDAVTNIQILTPGILQPLGSVSLFTVGVGYGAFTADTQGIWPTDEQSCYQGTGQQLNAYGEINVTLAVDTIQYQSGSSFSNINGTLYVLKGTSVTFKAIPNPANATFGTGQPVWSGSSGASGTGDTISVNFNTTSSSTSDYKTVIATAGNSMTVNVVVYELLGVFTPQDNFSGRSTSKFGLLENVDLSFTTNPSSITPQQIGGLGWILVSGSGTLPGTSNGTTTYTAPASSATATLQLKINSGPSANLGPSYNITIVAPDGGYEVQKPGTNVRHTQGQLGAGFIALGYLTPKDVSFSNISFAEGTTIGHGTGFFAQIDGMVHPLGGESRITACNNSTGCLAFEDIVDTGDFPPNPNPPYFTDGGFTWNIPWTYVLTGGFRYQFTTATHYQTASSTGRATITKAGSPTFAKEVNDPTSYF